MTYKTKLNEESEKYSLTAGCDGINGPGEPPGINEYDRLAFIAGSSWTLKYLSEQGKGFREFGLYRKEDGVLQASRISNVYIQEPEFHVVEHKALLASEAKRLEQDLALKRKDAELTLWKLYAKENMFGDDVLTNWTADEMIELWEDEIKAKVEAINE